MLTVGAASAYNTKALTKDIEGRDLVIIFDVNDTMKIKGKPFGEHHAQRALVWIGSQG